MLADFRGDSREPLVYFLLSSANPYFFFIINGWTRGNLEFGNNNTTKISCA